MKKLFLIFISLLLVVCTCACHNAKTNNTTNDEINNEYIIETLLYEKNIEKIKKTYENKITITEHESSSTYSMILTDNLGDITDGEYSFVIKDDKVQKTVFSKNLYYYSPSLFEKYAYMDVRKQPKDNMNEVNKEIEILYNSISEELNVFAYNVFGETIDMNYIEYGDISTLEDFKTMVSKLYDVDVYSEDETQVSHISFTGLDDKFEHCIRITIMQGSHGLTYQIKELALSE